MLTGLVKKSRREILLVSCHPRPASFTNALARAARAQLEGLGHEVFFHDLCVERFDPVLDEPELARGYSLEDIVQRHSRALAECDGMVVFHPDWWGQPPAQLKGWVDRVFRQGVAYDLEGEDGTEKSWKPLLAGKTGLVFCTSDSAGDAGSPRTLEALWEGAVLGRCGMAARCHVMSGMRRADAAARQEWMRFVARTLEEAFPRA